MDKNILREYAKLIAVSGVNVQPRQEVVVRAEPESLDFLETLVEELYLAGAGRVRVEWRYVPLTCLDIKYQDAETLGSVPKWEEEKLRHNSDTFPAMIYLHSDDPDGMRSGRLPSRRDIRYPSPTATRWRTSTSGASYPCPA